MPNVQGHDYYIIKLFSGNYTLLHYSTYICIHSTCCIEATVGFMYEVFLTTTKNTRCLFLLVTIKWVIYLGMNFPEW